MKNKRFAALFAALAIAVLVHPFIAMAQEISIAGTVYQSDGITQITDAIIQVDAIQGDPCGERTHVQSAWTGTSDGSYLITGLAPGDYYVQTSNLNQSNYINEWWASTQSVIDCSGAQRITVLAGVTENNKDFQLDSGAKISGTLYQSDGSTLITDAWINVEAFQGDPCGSYRWMGSANTNTGLYEIMGLPAGDYFLRANNMNQSDYVNEWWTCGEPCDDPSNFDCTLASPISVPAQGTVSDKNFKLDLGGTIAGKVTDAGTSQALQGVCLDVQSDRCWQGQRLGGGQTDGDGNYEIKGLPLGMQVYVGTDAQCGGLNYANEWYDDIDLTISCDDASAVTVPGADIDFQLALYGSISGRIADENGAGLQGMWVEVFSGRCWDNWVEGAYTDSNGDYTIQGLPAGDFYVSAWPEHRNYVEKWYDGNGGEVECDFAVAVTVVSDQLTPGINMVLEEGPIRNDWWEVAVYSGVLGAGFDLLPGFDRFLESAVVSGPNGFNYKFDLENDVYEWSTSCNYSISRWHDFDSIFEYGEYTLTLNFYDGAEETYAKVLQEAHPTPVDPATASYTVNPDGSIDFAWTPPSPDGFYHVRIYGADNNRYYRSGIEQGLSNVHASADELRCLEKGQTYRFQIRSYDKPWPYDSVEKSPRLDLVYDPAALVSRTAFFGVSSWKGRLGIGFDVRPGSRDHLAQATVTGPGGFSYQFDIEADWYDLSVENNFTKVWWREFDPIQYGEYALQTVFADGHSENIPATLNPVVVTAVDSATMNAEILEDGAMRFTWDLPAGVNGQKYSVRIRSLDGSKEYYISGDFTDESEVTAHLWHLRYLAHGQAYHWFVRSYDQNNYRMEESDRIEFSYDPFSIAPTGSVSGNVQDSGGQPIEGLAINVYYNKCRKNFIAGAVTDAAGSYTVNGVFGGDVYVEACADCDHKNYINEFWDGASGAGYCQQALGVVVADGQTTENINFTLEEGPRRLESFKVVSANGNLSSDFTVIPGFRDQLVRATLSIPNTNRPEYPEYTFDLANDKTVWNSECRGVEFWQQKFGLVQPDDYGDYTLTLLFNDGSQETHTDSLRNVPVIPVDGGSIDVTVNGDGSAHVSWTRQTSDDYYYRVRVRGDGNQEYYQSPRLLNISEFYIPAGDLKCLEPGAAYRWLVRVYDNVKSLFNTHETREKSVGYSPASLEDRTSWHDIMSWQGKLLLAFEVRPGSRNDVHSASVTGPDGSGFAYTFDLSMDTYDLSTATRLNFKGWAKEFDLDPIPYGEYTFDVVFKDEHTENYQKTLNEISVTAVDSNTMQAAIHKDGAVTFSWALPDGVTGQKYQVRLRNLDGSKEYYNSGHLYDGTRVTANFRDLRALEHLHPYQWFVRAYDSWVNTMAQSETSTFVYNPLSSQAPDEADPVVTSFVLEDPVTGATEYTTRRTVNIEMNATDDSGTVWRYLITETPDIPTVEQMKPGSANPYTSYDIQSSGEGRKTLHAWAMDGAGKVSIGFATGIVLDTGTMVTIDPVTSPTHMNHQTIGGLREAGAVVEVTCPTATVATINYPSDTTWSVLLSGLELGDHDITVVATDQFDNQDTGQAAIHYSVLETATIETGSYFLIADGQSTTPLVITVRDNQGELVADGTQAQVTTSLGEIIGAGTSLNGLISRTLKAPVRLGVAAITVKTADGNQTLGTGEVRFIPGPVTQLVLTTPEQSTLVNEWSSHIIVQIRDAYGHPSPVYEDAQIRLTSDSPGGRFYTGQGISSSNSEDLVISEGTSYGIFYYKDSRLGSAVITADETPDRGWAAAAQQIGIGDTAPHRAIISASSIRIKANGMDTASLDIEVQDINGNPVTDGTIVTVITDLGSVSGTGGTVNSRLSRNLKTGFIPGTAHLSILDSGGLELPGGVSGDTEITFLVDNPLTNAQVSPLSGYGDTSFTFSVRYINPGQPPGGRLLILDGVAREMQLKEGDPPDHGTYACQADGLDANTSHAYFFSFGDGTRNYLLPSTGLFTGPVVNLKNSTVTAVLSKSALVYGEHVTVSGAITPARSGRIEVRFTAPDGTPYTESTITNPDGFYAVDFWPDQVVDSALWSARAFSLADEVYDSSESREMNFSVATADTNLTIDVTPTFLSVGARVQVRGRLTSAQGLSVENLPIHILFSKPAPDGGVVTETVYTYTDEQQVAPAGHFYLPDFGPILMEGEWTVQARFDGNTRFSGKESETVTLKVSPVAGYAIVVQGRLVPDEDNDFFLEWHNRTANDIYKRLKDLGFEDETIHYLNYNVAQDGVDEVTSKGGVETAIKEWARDKMNTVPAPLYITFMDHGDINKFYLGADYISGDELDQWITSLEDQLGEEASSEKIVFIYGACHSASFIRKLSKPGKNRIIIASADTEELSYPDSPEEGESIGNGEFFLNKFFYHASTGKTIKRCFELAANRTQQRYRVPMLSNSFGLKHGDIGIQHPVLDDNGDGQGTHYLPTAPPGDGFVAHNMVIGIPPEDPKNVRLTQVSPLVTIAGGVLSGPLWAGVSNVDRCQSVWGAIKPPDFSFDLDPTRIFGENPHWRKEVCRYNEALDRYEYTGTEHFTQNGVYEIYFFARDSLTENISDFKRAYVIKVEENNTPPNTFNLLSPMDNEQRTSSLILTWEQAVDPDQGDKVSYIVQIAEDNTFDDPVYQSLEENMYFVVDKFAGLENLQRYYWRVLAADERGGVTPCAQNYWSFTTFNGNGIPGLLIGYIHETPDYGQGIANATAEVLNLAIRTKTLENGWFIMAVPAGDFNVRIMAEGYDEQIHPVNIQSQNRRTMSVGLKTTGDEISPTVALDDPETSLTVEHANYLISGTATDEGGSGLSQVEVSIDNGGTWIQAAGFNPWSYQATLALGENVIRVRAFDNAGNSNEADPITLTFDDTSNPMVTDIALDPPSPVRDTGVTFTIIFSEAMDPATPPAVTFGTPPKNISGQYVDSTTWRGTYTIATGYDGMQTITVRDARDIYDNQMDQDSSHTFVVDTAEPSAPAIGTSPQTVSSSAICISLSDPCTDDYFFSHYQLKGGLYDDWTDTTRTDNFIFDLQPGSNSLIIRGIDQAGNISAQGEVEMTRIAAYPKGDINRDRLVNLSDAILVLQVLSGVPPSEPIYYEADVNGDDKIGLDEVIYIMQEVVDFR